MRCEQLSNQLLLLVYDELPPAERVEVEQHLAQCAACQQALAELQGTQQLLDLAPARSAQVDLAKVCLRLATRERRAIAGRRWAWGGAALAASVALFMAVRLLDVELQPGRLTIAWRAAPAPLQPDEPGPSDGRPAPRETRAEVLADAAERWLDSDATALAAAYAQRWGGRLRGATAHSQQDYQTGADDRPAEPRTRTYGDWRRELLPADESLSQLSTLPGA